MKTYFVMVDEKDNPIGQQLAMTKDRAIRLFFDRTGIMAKPLTIEEFNRTLMHQD